MSVLIAYLRFRGRTRFFFRYPPQPQDTGDADNDEGSSTPESEGAFQVANHTITRGNEAIVLFGVNWFGAETSNYVVHGLWSRDYRDMIAQMKTLGFNAVRLPLCPTTLENVSPSSISFYGASGPINTDLQGLGSLEVLDQLIKTLDENEMYILLDHHRPDCQAISELWYTSSYSESDWIADLVFLADRYRDYPYFLGIDLKNEPHGAATWGSGNIASDWNQAAERAAEAILDVNPTILIFVEGVQEDDHTGCSSAYSHWWGGNLEPEACIPLDIPAEKLVLSPHVYGPDAYNQSYFNDPSFPDNMPDIWDAHFGFLLDDGFTIAPGEFGGKYGHGGDPKDVTWQDAFVDYLIDRDICHFFYWSWNPNSGDTGGILQDDWTTLWTDKYDNLKRLMDACRS